MLEEGGSIGGSGVGVVGIGGAGEEGLGEGCEVLEGRGGYGGDPGEVMLRFSCGRSAARLQSGYHLPLLAMSEEQLKAFLNSLGADTGLQAKIKAAVEGEIDTADETAAVLAIAKEAGFAITAADLLRLEAQNILELSDEELESVTGGTMMGGRFVGGRPPLPGGRHATQLSFGAGCHPTSRLGNGGIMCR